VLSYSNIKKSFLHRKINV